MLTFLSKLFVSLRSRFEPSVAKVTSEFQAVVKKLEDVADFHAAKAELHLKIQQDAKIVEDAASAEFKKAVNAASKLRALLS
jgi:hypothetical protein